MLRLSIDPHALVTRDLEPAVRALRNGGVVAFPTETFYGLAADPRLQGAVEKIYSVKRRPADRWLPLIAATLEQATTVGSMTPLAERLATHWWPGPLTLIVPAFTTLSEDVHLSGAGGVAVRVPNHPIACALAEAVGHPITSTSANVSGEPPSSVPEDVIRSLGDTIDVLIDSGQTPGGLPSTIVDATGDTPVLVRAGAIAWDRVLEFLR